jgi:hypothetical protein
MRFHDPAASPGSELPVETSVFDVILPTPQTVTPGSGTSFNTTRFATAQPQSSKQKIAPLIRLTEEQGKQRRFRLLQQFEGIVESVEPVSFWARLLDLTNPEMPVEFAEIPLDEISESDLPLLVAGAVFYWSIGRETRIGGQICRTSEIRLRRTPVWSESAIEAMHKRSAELFKIMSGNGQGDAATTG